MLRRKPVVPILDRRSRTSGSGSSGPYFPSSYFSLEAPLKDSCMYVLLVGIRRLPAFTCTCIMFDRFHLLTYEAQRLISYQKEASRVLVVYWAD